MKWIDEIYTFIDAIKKLNLVNFTNSNIKIYKFESPDFIVVENDKKIIGIEITEVNDQWHYTMREESLYSNEKIKHFGVKRYDGIDKKSIGNIKKHFDRYEKYIENIKSLYPLSNNIEVWYFITFTGQWIETEKNVLMDIKKYAEEKSIPLENIYCSELIPIKLKKTYQNGNWISLQYLIEYWINEYDY